MWDAANVRAAYASRAFRRLLRARCVRRKPGNAQHMSHARRLPGGGPDGEAWTWKARKARHNAAFSEHHPLRPVPRRMAAGGNFCGGSQDVMALPPAGASTMRHRSCVAAACACVRDVADSQATLDARVAHAHTAGGCSCGRSLLLPPGRPAAVRVRLLCVPRTRMLGYVWRSLPCCLRGGAWWGGRLGDFPWLRDTLSPGQIFRPCMFCLGATATARRGPSVHGRMWRMDHRAWIVRKVPRGCC